MPLNDSMHPTGIREHAIESGIFLQGVPKRFSKSKMNREAFGDLLCTINDSNLLSKVMHNILVSAGVRLHRNTDVNQN